MKLVPNFHVNQRGYFGWGGKDGCQFRAGVQSMRGRRGSGRRGIGLKLKVMMWPCLRVIENRRGAEQGSLLPKFER